MTYYRWLDYFSKQYRLTECEVVSDNGRTAVIRLLGYGKDGRPPGSVLRVRLASVVGYRPAASQATAGWHGHCYFD